MTKRIVVTGRVQGVGFRYHTEQEALRLGVTGEVWNRRDGAVEAFASHSDSAVIERFIERLRAGPGYVKDVEAFDTDERNDEGFRISPTR